MIFSYNPQHLHLWNIEIMADTYKVNIYIAEGGTPKLDPAYKEKDKIIPTGETADYGHMWYSIQQNDNEEECFGFAPEKVPKTSPFSVAGKVFTNDNAVYYKSRYKRTLVIEKEKYDALHEFGTKSAIRLKNKFEDNYYALNNSCVDFLVLNGLILQAWLLLLEH